MVTGETARHRLLDQRLARQGLSSEHFKHSHSSANIRQRDKIMDTEITTSPFSLRIIDGIQLDGVEEQHALIIADRAQNAQLQICVKASLLFKPEECLRLVVDAGFNQTYDRAQFLNAFKVALDNKTTGNVRVANRNGWIGREYTHQGAVISAKRRPRTHIAQNLIKRRSTAPATPDNRLIDYLNRAAYTSDLVALSVMVAFVGPLLRPLGSKEGAILYLHGQSRTGKTSLLTLINALSHPKNSRELLPFNFTERALEEKLYAANDGILCVDEVGTSSPDEVNRQLGEFIYKVTNGRGRTRSSASSVKSEFPNLTWRVVAVVTGEPDLATLSNRKHGSGQDARFLPVKVQDRELGGIFGSYDKQLENDGKDEIDQMSRLISNYTGDHLARWIRYLVLHRKSVRKTVRKLVKTYTDRLIVGESDSLIRSAAEKFAWFAACGEMLIEAKLFGWRSGFPFAVVERLYRAYRSADASKAVNQEAQPLPTRDCPPVTRARQRMTASTTAIRMCDSQNLARQ